MGLLNRYTVRLSIILVLSIAIAFFQHITCTVLKGVGVTLNI